jgi:RNA polymerase sigma-70 factor (ECF subfamily)
MRERGKLCFTAGVSRTTDAATDGLFRAWIAGDAEAGRTVVGHYYGRILRFFFDKVGPDAARDLAQETFVVLCDRKDEFRGDSSLRTFLFGIARWKLVHYFERRRLQGQRFEPASDSIDLPGVDASVTSLFSARRREVLLVRALRSLPLDDQVMLELKDYEGMTGRDIADVFGVGRDTISSRVTRARKRLAKAVAKLGENASLVTSTQSTLEDEMRKIRERIATSLVGVASASS